MLSKEQLDDLISNKFKERLHFKTIYKYSSFDVALEKIILDNTLKFSKPKVFNDPFDCNEYLLKPVFNNEMINNAIDKLGKHPNKYRNTIIHNLNNPSEIASHFKNEGKKYKLTCFSKTSTETLMWSHYSKKHTGICVGFDFPFGSLKNFEICGVNYCNEIKPIDASSDIEKVLLYWLITKSERWSYENEIRGFIIDNISIDEKILEIKKENISEVIFGCKVKESQISNSIKLIKEAGFNLDKIKFSRMEIDLGTFRLKKVSCKF